MNFTVPTRSYDVNVTPDKRKIFFSDESFILQSLREALEEIYSSNQASYSVNRIDELNEDTLTSNIHSPHERPQRPSKPLSTDNNSVVNGERDGIRDLCDEEMIQNDSARSVIEEFALGVHGNQKENNYASPDKQIVDLFSDKTDKHSIVQSRSNQKGTANTVNSLGQSSSVQMSLNKFITVNKRKHESIETALSEVPLLRNGPPMGRSTESNSSKCPAFPRSSGDCVLDDNSNKINSSEPRPAKVTGINSVFGQAGRSILYPCGDRKQNARDQDDASIMFPCMDTEQNGATENFKLGDQKTQKSPHNDNSEPTTPICKTSQLIPQNLSDALIPIQSPRVASNSPVVSSGSMIGFSLQFSFKDLMSRRKQRLSRLGYIRRLSGRINLGSGFTAASLELSQVVNEEGKAKALDAATIELERLFKKEDFKQMKVIGQFNLGFIIGKLDQDLFIVDQHAADEKHNYERLSQTTILNQQPLLRPLKMELAPEEEIVISMHMDTFRKNGFLLEEDVYAASGHRFILKAVPFSKNITFGIADIKELISILSDSHGECAMIGSYRSDTADSLCPPKVRAMLASRACRSSIMIGDSLGRNEMQKILEHLAVLKSPWNCPHGRPTMRHLVDLRTIRKRRDEEEDEEETG